MWILRLFVHDILMFVVYKSFLLVSRHQQSWTTPKRFDCSTGFRFYHNCICVYLSVYISLYLSKCLFKCVCIFLLYIFVAFICLWCLFVASMCFCVLWRLYLSVMSFLWRLYVSLICVYVSLICVYVSV